MGRQVSALDDDDAAATEICRRIGSHSEDSRLTLEGGAIEGDGQGRLLTHRFCLEDANRNPGWTREQIAKELHQRLGTTEIVWINGGGGLEGDDTDGHIDQLARFVTPTDVVVAVSSVSDDHECSRDLRCNICTISAWAEQTAPKVTVHAMPHRRHVNIGRVRVPESYCNFLMLADRAILVPNFSNRKTDQAAMKLLKQLRPNVKGHWSRCQNLHPRPRSLALRQPAAASGLMPPLASAGTIRDRVTRVRLAEARHQL